MDTKKEWKKELYERALKDICHHFPRLEEEEEKPDTKNPYTIRYHQNEISKALWIIKNLKEEDNCTEQF
jgi:hypothetical protein